MWEKLGIELIGLAQDRVHWPPFVSIVMDIWGQFVEFLDQLRECKRLKKKPCWVMLITIYEGCDHTTNEFVGTLSVSCELLNL
jgi:hypothetical protein